MTLESKHLLIAAAAVVLVLAVAGVPAAAADVVTSQPATQPTAALPTDRAKLLKQHVDKFSLTLKHINPHGPNIRPVVRLTVAEMGGRVRTWRISEAQAVKIIDHLAAEGFLASSRDIFVTKAPEITGPRCVLSVGGLPRVSLEENLGWNLKMLGRLDALRKVLDGKAGKAMAEFIKALEPQRKIWRQLAASFVKRMKASKRAINLVLRRHPADPRQRNVYPSLHLYWAAHIQGKLPATIIVMSRREALAAIDALNKAGYFELAGDITARRAMRTLTPWPEHKGPCYSLTVSNENLDCHANLGWGLEMLARLDALRKAFDKGSDAGKAMDKLLKALEPQRKKWQKTAAGKPAVKWGEAVGAPASRPAPATKKTAERAKLLKKHADTFWLTLRWHTTQGKSLSPGQSLQLTTVEADYKPRPFWTTVVISKQRAGKIIEHLAAEGFLGRASDVKPAKSYFVPKLKSYSLTVRTSHGPHLSEHMPWGPNLLKRVEGLRKVMADNRDAARVIDKILAPLKVTPAARAARPASQPATTTRDVKARRACMAALRKIRKDFAALAAKYPKELGHLGPGAIDEKLLLLRFPVKGLPQTTQPARRAASAGLMRFVRRPLQPGELGLFVQFTVPISKRPMARWLYSNVGFSWRWMWPNRSFSFKAQQGFMKMLSQALVPLNELENAMVAADLAGRKIGAFVLRGRPGVKLALRLAPKRATDGSAIIDLYATNETKKVVALCPPFSQIIADGKPWYYRAPGSLSMLIRAFGSGTDPFIYVKPGRTAKVTAVGAPGLSPGRHTIRVAAHYGHDAWMDPSPMAYDGPPINHKVPGAWTGVLVSGELAIDIPAPAATRPATPRGETGRAGR